MGGISQGSNHCQCATIGVPPPVSPPVSPCTVAVEGALQGGQVSAPGEGLGVVHQPLVHHGVSTEHQHPPGPQPHHEHRVILLMELGAHQGTPVSPTHLPCPQPYHEHGAIRLAELRGQQVTPKPPCSPHLEQYLQEPPVSPCVPMSPPLTWVPRPSSMSQAPEASGMCHRGVWGHSFPLRLTAHQQGPSQ